MTSAFSAQRTPKKMVQRVRFRSTREPPPKELPPPPMPKAPERPASLPEWSSTRKIRITDMITSIALSTVCMGGSVEKVLLARLRISQPVDSLQDRDRLRSQLPVEAAEV